MEKAKRKSETQFGGVRGNRINTERQFGKPNGNKRGNGFWKKEDTARFKLEKMIALSEGELLAIVSDREASLFERKLALCIKNGEWKVLEGMMNQVYGKPAETVKATVENVFSEMSDNDLEKIVKGR